MKKKKNYNLILGSVMVGLIMFFVVWGLICPPYGPETMDSSSKLASPSLLHIFGCDNFGRDIFSRVLVGCGTTMLVALCTVCIGVTAGILIGALTGYFGGAVDEIVMRIMDAVFAFPSILLALVIISVLGGGSLNIIIALGIAFIPSFARIVRSEVIRCKNMDYVKSARLSGAGTLRIIFVHILPNTVTVIVPSVMIGFNNAVLAEAGMSYLGLGIQPPFASLGRMLSEAQTYIFKAPWYGIFPGLAIIIMVLGFSLLSDGLKRE